MKTFHDVCFGLYLVCWFTFLRDFFFWENVYVMSLVSITHAVHFSKQEVLKRRAVRGSSSKSECSWNDGKKKQLKLDFFSMYFVRNNKEIHFCLLKIVKNSGHKLSMKFPVCFKIQYFLLKNCKFQEKNQKKFISREISVKIPNLRRKIFN